MADTVAKIEKFLDDLETLSITTQVGSDDATAKKIVTEIHLAKGDLKTTIHEDFITGPLQSLRDFHATQVEKGQTTVMNNIEAMIRVARQIVQSRRSDNNP
jgi:hypothetical protein